MNISKFLKTNKYIVLELDDAVEYLVDDQAVESIQDNNKIVILKRLYDGEMVAIDFKRIKSAILTDGIVDYLDK